jgi:predicted lipoprotein
MAIQTAAGAAFLTLSVTVAGCSAPGLWTFEGPGTSPTSGAAAQFNAATYVDGIWDSEVIPTISAKAVDAGTLLLAIDKDAAAATTQYGIPSATGGSPTFLIKGSGKVTKVDTSVPQGPVTVDLGGGQSVDIVTGPVITGTALRDAMGIKFGDFTNQIDFQNVATQLNNRAKAKVIAAIDLKALNGEELAFEGAFTLLSATRIGVVPTKLVITK